MINMITVLSFYHNALHMLIEQGLRKYQEQRSSIIHRNVQTGVVKNEILVPLTTTHKYTHTHTQSKKKEKKLMKSIKLKKILNNR